MSRKHSCLVVRNVTVSQLKGGMIIAAVLIAVISVLLAGPLGNLAACGSRVWAATFTQKVTNPTITQLCKEPPIWVGPVRGVKGVLTFDANDEDLIGGTPSVKGKYYSLSDGGHSVTVYAFGDSKLATGKVSFDGDWVEFEKGKYRLEPNP